MPFKHFFVFVVFLIVSLTTNAQSDTLLVRQKPAVSLIQAVNTLNACECFIESIRSPLSAEEHRMVTAYGVMRNLDFRTLDSLYRNSGDVIKLYCFELICSNFPDSLTDQHMQLLRNKHKIGIYQKQPGDFPKERISDIAYEMYGMIEKKRLEKIQKDMVEHKIRTFIADYAMYPESYIPISFTGYHQYAIHSGDDRKKVEDSEVHAIIHSYKLKTITGDLLSISHTFKVNADFVIMIIESEESTTVSCWPPKLDFWLNQFGRSLNDADKEALQLNAVVVSPISKRKIKKLLR
ncbi:MAG: hypothetical protein HYZ14_12210 [Bacteroidetes bacterium]|nr:hypothetical protein [Bacteroidota bacterium]